MAKLFLFIVYSFIFLCIGGSLVGLLLDLSPFAFFSWETKEIYINPLSDWIVLYKRFWYENWAVNSLENMIVFFSFLFFFPLYFLLWFFVRKVNWMKLFFKPFSFFRISKVSMNKNSVSSVKMHSNRPQALRQSKSFSAVLSQETSASKVEATSFENGAVICFSIILFLAKYLLFLL